MRKRVDEYWFLAESIDTGQVVLCNDEMHHMVHVLRIQPGTRVLLTDGKGRLAEASVVSASKKSVEFSDIQYEELPPLPYQLHIALAPTKNINRFEWFLEKATEIGITEITPIITHHSERSHIRIDRLEKIIVTAMKQSKKAWMPRLNNPVDFMQFIAIPRDDASFIAHIDKTSRHLKHKLMQTNNKFTVLIGPEGGFSDEEVELAIAKGIRPASLSKSRLRTETAGVVATQVVAMHYE